MINCYRSAAKLALLALASANVGCATVTSGKDQSLSFETDPVNASCSVSKFGTEIAHFQTPMTIQVHRAKEPILLTCTKTGYRQARAVIETTSSTGAWGNLLVGGIMGVMIDQSSGAAYRYYDPPRIHMLATTEEPAQYSAPLAAGITRLPDGDGPALVGPAAVPTATPNAPTTSVPTQADGTTIPPSIPSSSGPATPSDGWKSRFRL